MNVEFHPEASAEFSEAVDYYEERRSEVSDRFRDQIRRIVSHLRSRPDLGWPHLAETRMERVPGFPCGVIFLVETDCVRILAVAHFSRRFDYWFDRRSQ